MTKKFKPKEANQHYDSLQEYSDSLTKEISSMLQPFIKITDRYGRLISRITMILGGIRPVDIQHIVIRDLMADVFDCLFESRALILCGKLNVVFPVTRRAYESLSLLHLCALDKTWAEKWHNGKKIGNAEIRRELGKHPMGEQEKQLAELYNFFCSASHPNRELIPRRFLGEGNQFVLGVIGQPDVVLLTDNCHKVLQMWFWLTATVSYFYRDTIANIDKNYIEAYRQTAKEAENVGKWLIENFNKLLKEAQEYWEKEQVDT